MRPALSSTRRLPNPIYIATDGLSGAAPVIDEALTLLRSDERIDCGAVVRPEVETLRSNFESHLYARDPAPKRLLSRSAKAAALRFGGTRSSRHCRLP